MSVNVASPPTDVLQLTNAEDPYPVYAGLRHHSPVYFAPQARVWVVSRYSDILHVLEDTERFSSSIMGGGGASKSVLALDPPEHAPLRRALESEFRRDNIASWEASVERATLAALDDIEQGDPARFDLVTDFARRVPAAVMAGLLGFDTSRSEELMRYAASLVSTATGNSRIAQRPNEAQDLARELGEIASDRGASSRSSILHNLVRHGLSLERTVEFGMLLLVAGVETAAHWIGNALLMLLERPALLHAVTEEPSLVALVVEETLRFESPVQNLLRRTRESVVVGAHMIPAGATVVLLLGSGNRDERRFHAPGSFILGRPARSLAFGHGAHYCLGARLAKLEVEVAIRELLGRFPRLVRFSTRVERIDSLTLRGLRTLPVSAA